MKGAFIVPNYNKQFMLAHSINGMLKNEDSLIFIYDDASTDNSVEILKYFEAKHADRIFIQYGSENKGIGHAFNRLSEMVLQHKDPVDFVMIQGSDDYSFPGRIKNTIAMYEQEPGIDVLYGSFHKVDIFFNEIEKKIVPEFKDANDMMKQQHGQAIPHGFMAIRTKCLSLKYDENRKYGVDHAYILELIDKGYNFRKIPDLINSDGLLISSLGMYVLHQHCVSIQHREEIVKQDAEYFEKRGK
jgi:glycosyltransferase involved in cell wall biosynthesis